MSYISNMSFILRFARLNCNNRNIQNCLTTWWLTWNFTQQCLTLFLWLVYLSILNLSGTQNFVVEFSRSYWRGLLKKKFFTIMQSFRCIFDSLSLLLVFIYFIWLKKDSSPHPYAEWMIRGPARPLIWNLNTLSKRTRVVRPVLFSNLHSRYIVNNSYFSTTYC